MIRLIDTCSIRKICNGQVIVDLTAVVKELVENSLDAKSSTIEVKLINMGIDAIEVSDNGCGVHPNNFETVALKHYTSKIESFEDLSQISTLGFRGEALNAMCELSGQVRMITKHADQNLATELTFDKSGKIITETLKARGVGTTVTIERIFESLPVRRLEFTRNIKKQYQRMLKVLQCYAIGSVGVKLILSNSNESGNKKIILATPGTPSIQDNISALYGGKFLSSLSYLTFEVLPPDDDDQPSSEDNDTSILNENGPRADTHSSDVIKKSSMTGRLLISKMGEGVGRQDNDRQYILCNRRPVDLPKLSKLLNETWRKYEMKSKPAFVMDLHLPDGSFDVNVTPDKREIFIVRLDTLLDEIKCQVERLYEPSRSDLKLHSDGITLDRIERFTSKTNLGQYVDSSLDLQPKLKVDHEEGPVRIEELVRIVSSKEIVRVKEMVRMDSTKEKLIQIDSPEEMVRIEATVRIDSPKELKRKRAEDLQISDHSIENSEMEDIQPVWMTSEEMQSHHQKRRSTAVMDQTYSIDCQTLLAKYRDMMVKDNCFTSVKPRDDFQLRWDSPGLVGIRETWFEVIPVDLKENRMDDEVVKRKSKEKTRTLMKQDFDEMRVIGQFNVGFIVGYFRGDLYIIDQHSSDEKYRFEQLQLTTKIHRQPLLIPYELRASASIENIIEDYLPVFAANGFTIEVVHDDSDDAEEATLSLKSKKILLKSVPFSKGIVFHHEDVHELASMIQANLECYDDSQDTSLDSVHEETKENNNFRRKADKTYLQIINDPVSTQNKRDTVLNIRLPKLMSVYASRACRSAIMIGTTLNSSQMQRIIHNLSTLEQPWNCPHGRPTLQHLFDLHTYIVPNLFIEK